MTRNKQILSSKTVKKRSNQYRMSKLLFNRIKIQQVIQFYFSFFNKI